MKVINMKQYEIMKKKMKNEEYDNEMKRNIMNEI